jgi:hypothetical protein
MRFDNYPVVVDPVSGVVTLRERTEQPAGTWRHLSRVAVTAAAPFVSNNKRANVFGNAETAEQSSFLLCYDAAGFLTEVYHKEGVEWIRHEIPEEVSGRPETYPSMRIVFSTPADRDEFLVLWQRMNEAVRQLAEPSAEDAYRLLLIVRRQPHQPRFIDVGEISIT